MYNNKPTQFQRGHRSMQNIRQGQDSRTAWMCPPPQYGYNGGAYGQRAGVGHTKSISGMFPVMNPESSWSIEHPEYPPNQSRTNFSTGQQRGPIYNGAPTSNQVRSRSSYGTGFQPKPQRKVRSSYGSGFYQKPQSQVRSSYESGIYQMPQTQARSSYGTGFQQRPQTQMYTQNPQTSVPVAKISLPEGQPGEVLTGNLPPELLNNPNVNYVNLNWEDILGGNGFGGLQVSMAPAASGNQNRQIRIGMAGDQNPNDGSTPLKIVSFEPLNDFPGKITPTATQSQLKANVQVPTYQTGTFGQPQHFNNAAFQKPGYTGQVGQFGSHAKRCGSCTACQYKQPYSSRR